MFQALAQSIFMYGGASWVLSDEARKVLQGSYTRMLRFVQHISHDAHPTIADIYGDIPSITSQLVKQQLRMLGRTFRPVSPCPQVLPEVLAWMLGERQASEPILASLSPARRTLEYGYAAQLLTEIREILHDPTISGATLLAKLRSSSWASEIVAAVSSCGSPLFAKCPLEDLRSVFQMHGSPPPRIRTRTRRGLSGGGPTRDVTTPLPSDPPADDDLDLSRLIPASVDDPVLLSPPPTPRIGAKRPLRRPPITLSSPPPARPRVEVAGRKRPRTCEVLTPVSDRYSVLHPPSSGDGEARRSKRVRRVLIL